MGQLVLDKQEALQQRRAGAVEAAVTEALALVRAGEHVHALAILMRRPRLTQSNDFACYLAGVIHASMGHCGEALSYYERAAALRNNYAAAHYGRALMLQQLGRPEEALAAYDEAMRCGPADAVMLHNRCAALHQLGRLEEALSACAHALTLAPGYIPAMSAQARILEELGQTGEALDAYAKLLKACPADATVWHDCAAILAAQGQWEPALQGFLEALSLLPEYTRARYGAAKVLQELGRQAEALEMCTELLRRVPDHLEALILQGNLLHEAGRLDEAMAALDAAVRLAPADSRALCNRGATLHLLGRQDEAAASYDAALLLTPDFAEAWLGQGNVHLKSFRLEEALASFGRARQLAPDYAKAHCGCALALREMGRFAEAAECFERSLALDTDLADTHANYGAMQLLLGDFERGWEGYEYRRVYGEHSKFNLIFPWPEWKGEPLAGKRIAVLDEAAHGDVLMLARYLPVLAAMGARVTLQCRPSMLRVLAALRPAVVLVEECPKDAEFDFCIPYFSLPRVFRTRINSIPAPLQYLRPEPALAAKWAERIGMHGFRIGINWQGSPDPAVDIARSAPLTAYAPLSTLNGVRLISLQKHHGLEQIAGAGFAVETLGDEFDAGPDAFADTAAAMASLDLVVTVDTSIAHLAGALGRPVWVALKQVPEWRWMMERETSPWYPSMRLFRQQMRGDWGPVFSRMAAVLRTNAVGLPRRAP
jgi:tetratricopeptide (TPR) repeat protein